MKLPSIAQVHLDTFVINVSIALKFEGIKDWDSPYTTEWRYYGSYIEYHVANLLRETLLNGASKEKYNMLAKINEAKTPTEFTDTIKELMEYYTDKSFYASYVESYFTHTKANYNDWKRIMRPDATLPIIASTNDMTFTLNEQFDQLTPSKRKLAIDHYWQQVEKARVAVLKDWDDVITALNVPARPYIETQRLTNLHDKIKQAQHNDNEVNIDNVSDDIKSYVEAPTIQPLLDEIKLTEVFLEGLTVVQMNYLGINYEEEAEYLIRFAQRHYRNTEDVNNSIENLQQKRDRYKQRLQDM